MNMKWNKDTRKYSCGKCLLLGKWNVGGVFYDGLTSKDDPLKYASTCNLPGIKSTLGHYASEEEAMKRTEEAVKYWISKSEI